MCISVARPRRGWEDIIKMELQEAGSRDMVIYEAGSVQRQMADISESLLQGC